MLGAERINRILKRHRAEESFPVVATINDNLFLCHDTEKQSLIGAFFVGRPITGVDQSVVDKLRAALSQNYPPDTYIQINLLSTPHIHELIDGYHTPKVKRIMANPQLTAGQRDALLALTRQRADYLFKGRLEPHIRSVGVPCRLNRLLISIKIPSSIKPTEDNIAQAEEYAIKLQESLRSAGIHARRALAADYLKQCRSIFYPFARFDDGYDGDEELRNQMLTPGTLISTMDSRTLKIDDTCYKMLSVKRLPKSTSLALMNQLIGEPGGLNNQLTSPYMLSLTLHYPDQISGRGTVKKEHAWINHQTTGFTIKFSPRLAFKKKGYELLFNELETGGVLAKATLTMTLMGEEPSHLNRLAAQLETFYASYGLEMVTDSQILWPLLWNNLPLFPSPTSTMNLCRQRTLTINQAVQFLPLFSDWTGTAESPCQMFTTRRGELFGLDIFNSRTNYNGLIFGGSGGGKSFLTQSFILDELAQGAKVWVVDQGRSYEKLAKAIDGEFIAFHHNSRICLNPFTHVVDIDDEVEMLTIFLEKMSAPREGLDDYRRARLTEAIKAVWSSRGCEMTITDVQEYLYAQKEDRVRDIAVQLFPFTRQGQFGYWFDGRNNLRFQKNFVVLELDDLKQQEVLQKVVLMLLVSRIQYEMYNHTQLERKLAIFDEAKEYLEDPITARFLADGYRRFRKLNGSAWLVTQSLKDVDGSPGMNAIVSNAAFKIILPQEASEVERLADSKLLPLDTYTLRQMKSVQTVPGLYSEIMVMQGNAWGIVRLTLPRYLQILFSTRGLERTAIFEALHQGVSVDQAIRTFIKEHG